MEQKKERKSGLELLRIIAMILIVAHHYSVHGNPDVAEYTMSLKENYVQIISLGGKLGVNLFVLITGYFISNSKFKLSKLIALDLQIIFYSVGIYSIIALMNGQFSSKGFFHYLLPIINNIYWFASLYVLLYIFSTYMNKAFDHTTEKQHRHLLIFMFVIWSVLPTVFEKTIYNSSLCWYIFVYILGSYIKKYYKKRLKNYMNLVLASGCFLFVIISVLLINYLGVSGYNITKPAIFYREMNMIPMVIGSVFLFLFFLNLDIHSRIINHIAACMFGVYLIHDHLMVRPIIWSSILVNNKFTESQNIVVTSIVAIASVFIFCTVIEWLRIRILGNVFKKVSLFLAHEK